MRQMPGLRPLVTGACHEPVARVGRWFDAASDQDLHPDRRRGPDRARWRPARAQGLPAGRAPTAPSTSSTRRSGSRSRPGCASAWPRSCRSSRTSCSTLGRTWRRRPTSQARHPVPTVETRHIEKLERLIDELNEVVGPLDQLPAAGRIARGRPAARRPDDLPPGGARGDGLARDEAIGPTVLPYLNRLSDALFVMARYENHERRRGRTALEARHLMSPVDRIRGAFSRGAGTGPRSPRRPASRHDGARPAASATTRPASRRGRPAIASTSPRAGRRNPDAAPEILGGG